MPLNISPEDILRENERRQTRFSENYDPETGDPDDPGRFHFCVKGLECHLPSSMRHEQMVNDLMRFGSLNDYLANTKGTAGEGVKKDFFKRWNLLRARHDFPFWAFKFARIKKKGGGDDIPFRLNYAQRRLVASLEEMRTNNLPIRLILLKARQWGGSTCVQLYMSWLQLLHQKGLNSLIIAHQKCATDEIKDMFDRMLLHYPDELLYHDEEAGERRPKKRIEKVGSAGAAFRIMARNCKVKIGTAERPDSCRGGDYNLIHCSEVGLWKDTRLKSAEDIHRAASSGVLLMPMTMILMESTANGTGNFFHREYEAARKGESQFKALFIAWFEIGQYQLPIPDEEKEEFARTLIDGRDAEHSQSDRRQPGSYLWKLWEMGATLEGIKWYIAERGKYSDHGLMAAEYPSDDVEAFVHSGARVFDKYCVENLRPGCRPPLMTGEIDGDDEIGRNALRNVRFNPSANGALLIWKDRGWHSGEIVRNRYLVVVDIGGRSVKADWSVITVFDRVEICFGGKPEIAAQWRGHLDHDLLAWKAARIAAYFDNALLVIESNTLETRHPGRISEPDQSAFLLNSIREVYFNLYARRQSEESIRIGEPVKYGFHTNTSTKPMIISTLVRMVREGEYVERDERCLSEYLTYEQRPNGSYAALPGFHDDMLMTRAIGLHISSREMPPPVITLAGSAPYRRRGLF